ncbi:MAG TPA: AMP-binding protein, partial [Allocoleopsis sp.]
MQWTDKTLAHLASVDQFLGRTVPDLLDESCDQTPNDQAFHQWIENKWKTLSNAEFRSQVESIALGFSSLGLQKGDRIALLMHSNVNFCLTDLGCLLANLVDVPLDLTQTLEHLIFVLQHSEAKGLVISNLELLTQVLPYLHLVSTLQVVVVVDVPSEWQQTRSKWLAPASALSESTLSPIPESDIPDTDYIP